jgi:hypothetical protein
VAIERHLEAHKMTALVKVETDAVVTDGLIALVKSYGFGPLVPNTVVLGKAETPDDPILHAELLATIQRRGRNLIVVHEAEDLPALEKAHRMDVWWRGPLGNIGLMLALTFLLKKDEVWEDAETMVWRIVESEDEVESATKQINEILAGARFPATVQVVCHAGDPFEAIRHRSQESDLLFLGLRPPEADESLEDYAGYYADLARKTDGLPPTVLVSPGKEVDLHRLFASV